MLLEDLMFDAQTLLDMQDDPVVVVGSDYKVVGVNSAFADTLGGVSPGHNLLDFLSQIALKENLRQLTQETTGLIWLDSKGVSAPFQYHTKDLGSGVSSIRFQNVSDKFRYEETIDRSRRNIEDIMAHVDSAVYYAVSIQGGPTRLMYISPRIEEILGMDVSEIMTYSKTNRLADIFHPEDWSKLRRARLDQLMGKSVGELEYRIYHQETGDIRRIRERIVLQKDPVSNRTSYFGIISDVTEESLSQLQLDRNKEDFGRLVQNLPIGLISFHNGKAVELNREAKLSLLKLNLEPEEVYELVKDSQNDLTKESYEVTLAIGQTHVVLNARMIRDLRNEGGKEFLILREKPTGGGAGSSSQDFDKLLADNEESRNEIRKLQALLSSIYNSSQDSIVAINNQGMVSLMNRSSLEHFQDLNEGDNISKVFNHPEELDDLLGQLDVDDTVTKDILINRNGLPASYHVSASRLSDFFGNKDGALLVIRDITPMLRARRGQQRSEQNYVDLFENSTDAVLLLDKRDNVVYANRQWSALTGYGQEEGRLINIQDNLSGKQLERWNESKRAARNTGVNQRVHLHLNAKSGAILDLSGNLGYREYDGRGLYRVNLMNQTELKKSQAQLQEHQSFIDSILSNSSDFIIYAVDADNCLMSYNVYLEKLAREMGKDIHIGSHIHLLFDNAIDEKEWEEYDACFKQALSGNPSSFDSKVKVAGAVRWLSNHLAPIYLSDGEVMGVTVVAMNITERKRQEDELRENLEEKEVLLKEVHHRVKNNMQVISSMLNLQEAYMKNPEVSRLILESQNRIKSMSLIHESLYRNKDFSKVGFSKYLEELSRSLFATYRNPNRTVDLVLDMEDVQLSLDQSIPCGLVVNEILSNALKYAFPPDYEGDAEIFISVREENGQVVLTIRDNGIGLPKGFDAVNSDTLGMQLIQTLAEQVEASLSLEIERGTEYSLKFEKL